MTRILVYIHTLLFLLLMAGCNNSTDVASNKEQTLIKIKGSSSEMNLMEFFKKEYIKNGKEVDLEISGGGSSVGIKALINNEVQIANSSRPINASELQEAKKNGFNPVQTIVAVDAIAIISNPANGLDSLSLDQIKGIFSGKIERCDELGGNKHAFKIFGRDVNSGTHQFFLGRLNMESFGPSEVEFADNKDIIESVMKTKGGIGYINLGSLLDPNGVVLKGLWPISVFYEGSKAISPLELQEIRNGDYPLIRPLFQYTRGVPGNELKAFLDFELDQKQQSRIEEHGYFPITPIHKAVNLKSQFP